jgi:hypothetical protein
MEKIIATATVDEMGDEPFHTCACSCECKVALGGEYGAYCPPCLEGAHDDTPEREAWIVARLLGEATEVTE